MPIDNSTQQQSNSKKKNAKKSAANKNQQNQSNSFGNNNNTNLTTNTSNSSATQPMIVMNDQNQFQLLSNQNALVNSQPTTNYQLLPNGQLCSTGDSLAAAPNSAGNLIQPVQPGQIIISQPFINQQSTSAILLPNGQIQLVPVMQNQFQNQPNLIYHTNSGIMLTNSVANSVTTNTSVNNQSNLQTQPQNSLASLNQNNSLTPTSNTIQLNKMNQNFTVNPVNSISSTPSAILNKTTVITNTTKSMQNNNLPINLDNLNTSNSSMNNSQNNSKSNSKSKKNTTPKTPKKSNAKSTNVDKPVKQTKTASKKNKKANSSNNNNSNSNNNNVSLNSSMQMNEDNNLGRSMKDMKDILATATASIFDLGKMDDMDMMSDFNEPPVAQQPSTSNSKPIQETNQTNTDLINCTINNIITDSIIDNNNDNLTKSTPSISQQTSKATENSIMPQDEKVEPSNKKQKLDENLSSVDLEEDAAKVLMDNNNQSEMQDTILNEDDNPTADIDKILSMSNDQAGHEATTEHEEVNFDYITSGTDQLNENDNQAHDNSFLNSLTNTTDPLNEFLQKSEENSKNLAVENLFSNPINQMNEVNPINSVNQISHSISSLTTDKPNNNYAENSKKPVDTFKQSISSSIDINQTQDTAIQPNTSSSTANTPSSSSFLSYSAESLITNVQQTTNQTSQNKTIRPNISYSAESLIHSSSSCTTSMNSNNGNSREDQTANKKSIVNNFSSQTNLYNSSPILAHNTANESDLISPSNQLSQSPVDSHHSSRPPSNSMLSPHQPTTTPTNHLNRSLNSVNNNNLNNSFNKELNPNFLFNSNNDERNTSDNSSLFSSSTVNNTSNSNQQHSKHLYNQNRNLYNSTDHLLNNSTTTTANQQQSNSSFFTQSFNPSTSLNSYQLSDPTNPILSSFNYKDPLNTSQASTNYQSSLISNQNKFAPTNLFPNPMFQEPLLDSSNSRKNSNIKRSNLSPNPVNKNLPNKKSANKLHQNSVQTNTTSDYSSSSQNQQIPSNRQTQFYLDSPLANNNPIGNDFMNTYFSMPDFSSSNSGANASNTNTNKQLTTSSAFTNQTNCNDNYFLRPTTTQNSSSSSFSLNSTNQLNNNQPIQNQVTATNRPNFNLSNIIPDIGQVSSNSLTNPAASINSSRQASYSTQNFFGAATSDQASSQFSGSHAFSNILNSSGGGGMDSSNQQHSALHHLHTNPSNSSLNNLHRQTNSTPANADANLYRFNSTQIVNQFSNQNNPMNSLNMPLGSNLSNTLNSTQPTTGNGNLIAQNMTTNQNPYGSFSLPFI